MKNSEETGPNFLRQTVDAGRFQKEFARVSDLKKVMEYSDEHLQEFKCLVLTKLEELRGDYFLLKNTLSRHDSEAATYIISEDAADVFSKEQIAQLAILLQRSIDNLRNILGRIENKTYSVRRIHGNLMIHERPDVPVCTSGKPLELCRLN